MVEKVDRDGDREVGFPEFVQILASQNLKPGSAQHRLQELLKQYRSWFDLFDLNGNGSVPLLEFNSFMASAGNALSAEELAVMDDDGNGYIEVQQPV